MQRRKLLEALARYGEHYPKEYETVKRFTALLDGHPNCFERDCWAGHITGSAWLVDPTRTQLLLTHHRKLDMWLQLGGHSDGEMDTVGRQARSAGRIRLAR